MNEDRQLDAEKMAALGELESIYVSKSKEEASYFRFEGQSISEAYGDKLLTRAPDKMIDILQGNLMLAYRDMVIYCNVNKYGVEDTSKRPKDQDPNYIIIDI